MWRYRTIKAGARYIPNTAQLATGQSGNCLGHARHGIAGHTDKVERLAYVVELSSEHEFYRRGFGVDTDRPGFGRSGVIRCQVVGCRCQFHARGAINGGMVCLGKHGKAAFGHAFYVVQALDNIELPQWVRAVQLPCVKA